MLTYEEMRKVLAASSEKLVLDNFTPAFFKSYCDARKSGNYEEVFSTNFYRKDGFSYCVFQELFYASLPCWELQFTVNDRGWPTVVGTRTLREETEADAKAAGMNLLGQYNADHVDVFQIAS